MKIVLVAAAVIVLAVAVLAASAKLDTPAKSETVNLVVDAPREAVWAALADLDSYASWNPYITEASGDLREGSEVRLVIEAPGEEREDATMKVLTARFERKLRLEDRLVLPGIRDEELTFRVIKLTPERVRFEQTVRMEGLLAPFADLGPATEGLEQMAQALAQRVEDTS